MAFAYLINVLPEQVEGKLIRADLGEYTGEIMVSGLLFLTAIAAWALSKRVVPENIKNVFTFSFIGVMALFIISAYMGEVSALFPLILVIPTLALLSISAFPMAMAKATLRHKMLAAGLFISGAEFPDSLLELLL